jgi:hypothetical protein
MFNKYRESKSNRDYEKYQYLKNKTHVLCKERYNDYINSIVMDEDQKPKRLWSFEGRVTESTIRISIHL